jgi:hypothetical protein
VSVVASRVAMEVAGLLAVVAHARKLIRVAERGKPSRWLLYRPGCDRR